MTSRPSQAEAQDQQPQVPKAILYSWQTSVWVSDHPGVLRRGRSRGSGQHAKKRGTSCHTWSRRGLICNLDRVEKRAAAAAGWYQRDLGKPGGERSSLLAPRS